jgi:hypothetical protein
MYNIDVYMYVCVCVGEGEGEGGKESGLATKVKKESEFGSSKGHE